MFCKNHYKFLCLQMFTYSTILQWLNNNAELINNNNSIKEYDTKLVEQRYTEYRDRVFHYELVYNLDSSNKFREEAEDECYRDRKRIVESYLRA